MNPAITHRLHIGGLSALIIVVLVSLVSQLLTQYPPGYGAYKWFGPTWSAVIALLLGVRFRQVVMQAVIVETRPGIERLAVNVGQLLIVLGAIGLIVALISHFFGEAITTRLTNNIATASLWAGLACIELVIANGRGATLGPDERPGGAARIGVGLLIFVAGFLLGVFAVIAFFLMALTH